MHNTFFVNYYEGNTDCETNRFSLYVSFICECLVLSHQTVLYTSLCVANV